MLRTMKTVATNNENAGIHLWFHLIYVSRAESIIKNEYQSRVSPVVRIGGRCRDIQKRIMKVRKTPIPDAIRLQDKVLLPFFVIAITEPESQSSQETEAKIQKCSQLIKNFLVKLSLSNLLFVK